MTPFTLFASIDPHISHFLIAVSLCGLLFSILYGILSRDLSKDLKKLPEDIPTNNLFDPQGFFDSKTQKVIQEMNQLWSKDYVQTQLTVVIAKNMFHYPLDSLSEVLVERWKLNDLTSPIHHIVLLVDIKEQSVTTIISEQLADILTPEKRDELNDLFAKSFKGLKFDSGLRAYMDELDYMLHMTRTQKEKEKRDHLLQEIKENQDNLEASVHTQTLISTLNLLKK
mgnify:CR=1 FL=1|jgi:uncharacterized membrane protein YgcG